MNSFRAWYCVVCDMTVDYSQRGEHDDCLSIAESLGSRPHQEETEPKKTTRKDMPVFSGVMQYFPDALLEISHHSKKGNDKHNPGEPLRWAKEKSSDQADCIARHLIDIGPNWDAIDEETDSYHATALAWRALALLQTVLERKKNASTKA